jgi:fatty-acyl-CoA synthase
VQRPDFETLKAFAAQRLASYKVPREVLWVPEVPRSPAGKQDYKWASAYAASH